MGIPQLLGPQEKPPLGLGGRGQCYKVGGHSLEVGLGGNWVVPRAVGAGLRRGWRRAKGVR